MKESSNNTKKNQNRSCELTIKRPIINARPAINDCYSMHTIIITGPRRVLKKRLTLLSKYSVAILFNWFLPAQQSKLFGVLDAPLVTYTRIWDGQKSFFFLKMGKWPFKGVNGNWLWKCERWEDEGINKWRKEGRKGLMMMTGDRRDGWTRRRRRRKRKSCPGPEG